MSLVRVHNADRRRRKGGWLSSPPFLLDDAHLPAFLKKSLETRKWTALRFASEVNCARVEYFSAENCGDANTRKGLRKRQ